MAAIDYDSSDSSMSYEYPPSDPAHAGDLLLQQMNDLCDNIYNLQELMGRRLSSVPPTALRQRESGLGDFEPTPAIDDSNTDEGFGEGEVRAVQEIQTSIRTQPPTHTRRNPQPILTFMVRYMGLDYFLQGVQIFLAILQVVVPILTFLSCVSTILAIFFDEDLLDTFLEKYFGGTVLEDPLIWLRNNWQLPMINELRCMCRHLPLYRSPRRRYWDAIYTFFTRSNYYPYPGVCVFDKTILGRLRIFIISLWNKPPPPWSGDFFEYIFSYFF